MLSSSVGDFQIPNRFSGARPSPTPTAHPHRRRPNDYPSAALDENQRELTHFAILSWQHSQGALDVQTSLIARYSSLTFTPDPLGRSVVQRHRPGRLQAKCRLCAAIRCGLQTRTMRIRCGRHLPAERSLQELYHLAGASHWMQTGNQISDVPDSIVDDGGKTEWIESVYLQDEWKAHSGPDLQLWSAL